MIFFKVYQFHLTVLPVLLSLMVLQRETLDKLAQRLSCDQEMGVCNRVNGVMPHRTGSKPHRQMIYEKISENETPLDVAQLFYETRQKNGKLEPQAQKKYDEIAEIVKSNPSLSDIEVVEQSFGPQCNSHIFGFGGGVKRKDFDSSQVAYIKELEAKLSEKNEELREKDAENHKLRSRFDAFESRLARIEDTQNEESISTPTPNI